MTDDRLTRVISCAGAADILDELAGGPRVFGELRRILPRRVLEPALRVLAAEGVLGRSDAGSWDVRPGRTTVFALTAAGHGLIGELSDLDEWVAVYERYLYGW